MGIMSFLMTAGGGPYRCFMLLYVILSIARAGDEKEKVSVNRPRQILSYIFMRGYQRTI